MSLSAEKQRWNRSLTAFEQVDQQPVITDKKKGAAGSSVEKSKKAAEQQRRKELLQKKLDDLLRDSDTLLQDAQQ